MIRQVGQFHRKIDAFIRALIFEIFHDECPSMAAEMAYHLMLALFPTLIFIFTLFGMIGNTRQVFPEMLAFIYRLTPPDAAHLLRDTLAELFRGSTGELALFSFVGAFIATSNGAFVVMRALNRAYDIPVTSNFVRQRGRALLVTLSLGAFLLLGANMLIFGELLLNWMAHEFDLPGLWMSTLSWVRWIMVLIGVTLAAAVVYAIIPHSKHRRIHWSTTLPGALVFIALWFTVSKGFTLYVENMGRYNQVYGAMGAVIVLMVWLYFTSLALLIGAEVNGLLDRCRKQAAQPED